MATNTALVNVKPRDLRPGDLLQRLRDDFSIGYVAVESVEKIRPRATVYKVMLEGDPNPMYLQPSHPVQVRREIEEA